MRELDALHEKFHHKCAEAIDFYKQKNVEAVEKTALEFKVLSSEVLVVLDTIKKEAKA